MKLTTIKAAIMGLAVISITGCATKLDTVAVKDSANLKTASGSLKTVTEPAPDLMHSQSSKAGFGLLGAAANINAGKKLVAKGVLTDPSLTVEAKLSEYLTSKSGLTKSSAMTFESRKDVPDVPTNEGGYVIDAETVLWGLNYFPLNWTSYQTYYTGNVRLIDPEGDVIASTNCEYKYPETKAESPEYDVLVSGGGVILQQNLQLLADKCVEQFKTETLAGL
jgi:hypothetical protein